MTVSRRDCLRLGLFGSAATALGGCARIANHFAEHHTDASLPPGNVEATTRLVNRTTFGPRPGDISHANSVGREEYVNQLLKTDEAEDLRLQFLLERLDVFQMDSYEGQDLPENEVLRQLQISAILRATYGKHQLQERMVDLWTNHFNIYGRKGLSAFRKAADETTVIRKNALGTFPALLKASAHSPAMLMFLDNQGNVSGRPNENYAREIMELHTMGVNSGYTQKDVQEVARCFTGWTIEKRFLHHRWAFRFDETQHDNGQKVVLGHIIPAGGGEKDADYVLDLLAQHPATAHFVAKKICTHFLGTDADKWIDQTAKTYLATKGDIPSMVKPILLSDDLLESPPILKRPFDYMVAALRALDADTDGGAAIQDHLVKMGEPLYQWPMPDGYPVRTSAWTGSMLPRWNFAHALVNGKIGGTHVDWDALNPDKDAERTFEITHARRPTDQDRELLNLVALEFRQGEEGHEGAGFLCLAAPSFQWR
jgi:uncharacterized protein (DUF1800 family)